MAPKPFPYPIGVGVDICHSHRLYATLGHPSQYVTTWARKIFTRQEWPCLLKRCSQASGQPNFRASLWIPGIHSLAGSEFKGQAALPQGTAIQDALQTDRSHYEAIPRYESGAGRAVMEVDSVVDVHPGTTDPPLPLSVSPRALRSLAQHIAGRWAAKEATIKAHRHRSLSLTDISILSPGPEEFSQGSSSKLKVQALVAPEPTTWIVMDSDVANARGLSNRQSSQGFIDGEVVNGRFVANSRPEGNPVYSTQNGGRKFFTRRAKIREEDQQIAEISISHDGDYAVAVCMALDEPRTKAHAIRHVLDDGLGEPLHEPETTRLGRPNGNFLLAFHERDDMASITKMVKQAHEIYTWSQEVVEVLERMMQFLREAKVDISRLMELLKKFRMI
ncbi:MAG: hypothetical protein Q9173_000110 [Seirophora scorigena]